MIRAKNEDQDYTERLPDCPAPTGSSEGGMKAVVSIRSPPAACNVDARQGACRTAAPTCRRALFSAAGLRPPNQVDIGSCRSRFTSL